MDNFFKNIYTKLQQNTTTQNSLTDYVVAKKYIEFKITTIRYIKDALLILIGVASATFGLKSFILPNHFIDGGAMGISLLIAALTPFSLASLIILLTCPLCLWQ